MNRGIVYALGAYALWGVLPVFWKALQTVPAAEILSQRIVWSLFFMASLLTLRRDWGALKPALKDRATLLTVLVATALLAVNWLTYIWGVNAGYVVEASLGYFINPLVNVVLGVLFLREKLRLAQWLPVGLAILGVVYLTLSYGELPWIALVLAFTFAFYGLIKKTLRLGPFHSFTLEVGGMALPALAYLLYLELAGQGAFGHQDGVTTVLLALTGVVTALPLLWFATAARRIPFSTLGLLQYVTPTLQFLLGVWVYGEPFTPARMVGFALIWAALLLYSLEGIVVRRRTARTTPAR